MLIPRTRSNHLEHHARWAVQEAVGRLFGDRPAGALTPPVDHTPNGPVLSLAAFVAAVDGTNRDQPNSTQLEEIRQYNHSILETFNLMRPFAGRRLLDIGASSHGYALESALSLGIAEYVGINLDMASEVDVGKEGSFGRLLKMNAEQLDFEDETFDLVVSASTFEHIHDVKRTLAEIRRVLKSGGSALVTFEPIWTSALGHHLHHFGPVSSFMPDWAHLMWTKEQMLLELASIWPREAPLGLEAAAEWTFEGGGLNRIGIVEMRNLFRMCGLAIEWMVDLPDCARDPRRLAEVSSHVGLKPDDLIKKGLSVLLNKG